MNRYWLHEKIGKGAWGEVYRATDPMTKEVVAVKVIARAEGFPKSEFLYSRRITDPHVCRTFDYYRDDNGDHCLPMELAAGGNLRNWMEQHAPAPWKQCRTIAIQMLQGLRAAHKEGIVHRDLKPENILFTADGRVLLSDFGHARPVGAVPRVESLHQLGTVDYMAPEQSKGYAVDGRADLFSFGVVLEEMLTGQLPNSLSPVPLPRHVPARVRRVIRCCLESRKEDRFASAEEVIAALERPGPQRKSFYVFFYGLALLVLVAIPIVIGLARGQIEVWPIEPPPRLAARVQVPVPGLILNFKGPLGQVIEKAIIAGGKYKVVDRDYIDSNLAKLKKPDPAGILGATYSLSGESHVTQGRLHINAKLIHIQSMTVVTSEGVEGDPGDAVRLAEQLAKLF